jgi:hypothetical protein
MLLLGVELLATTIAGKHMATVLPNFVLAMHLQRLESFVTDITEVSRCQKMSTPLHGLPKADDCLEGVVADDKADPLVCLQLHQTSVLQYFF